LFPVAAGFELALAAPGDCIVVRSLIEFAFFDEAFVDERVEVRLEPAVVDLFLVVILEFVFDGEAFGFVEACDGVQEVALEVSQIINN
jgi:hypothetical protein